MIKLLFRIVVWLNLPDRSKDWEEKDCTWTMTQCATLDHFPWKFGDNLHVTTYSHGPTFSQMYGRFRATFKMEATWCFWLLQLENHQYLEIDHFEILEKSVAVSTYKNPLYNSKRRIPWKESMNPMYEGHAPILNILGRVQYRSRKVREYILRKERRYDIVWRKRFILWKVDGWPCGVVFRHIPRQPQFLVVSGPKKEDIRELQVKL